ncbi:MAG: DNA alkylation repair protein [Candidatus Pacebacteria bacterium]|nr:DNA alkylation repair protein [Candidatus Paceibacterota bacterium]
MDILTKIRRELLANSDEKIKESSKRFFKEKIKVYGIKTAFGLKLAKDYYKEIKELPKKEIFALCEKLFKSGYMEEAFIACNWANYKVDEFEIKDIEIFENWLNKYIDNWAECDTLCNHTIGDYLEKYPSNVKILKKWAKSENLWLRRASSVSLILPARKGNFLKEVFELADILLLDKEDLVQKGYGWMLKEASREHQKEVFDYVVKNKKIMPRTALRYAIEKMPKELKTLAMEK